MNSIACMSDGQIEVLAKALAECGSGSEITRILESCGLTDDSGESTKWRRLNAVFLSLQRQDQCANRILDFIRSFLAPTRFVGRKELFDQRRVELNDVLAFSGLELGSDGQFRQREAVKTLGEAERRSRTIHAKFEGRRLHPEVLKYCKAELMQDNYFHAVFEATKSLAQRIRNMTGVQADGSELVDRVFSVKQPLMAMNALQTDTEKSEHKGFATLLKGCFGAIRNPLAHEPKILWQGEDDAADYLSLISLLHRKLDDCVLVKQVDSR